MESIASDCFWIVSRRDRLLYRTSFIMFTVWIILSVIASFDSFAAELVPLPAFLAPLAIF